jgi:hypothetical protein
VGSGSAQAPAAALHPPTVPNFNGGPPDDSQSVVQHNPLTQMAYPSVSAPLRDIPPAPPITEKLEHEPRPNPFPFAPVNVPDPVLQTFAPITRQLMAVQNFLGQGQTLGGCIFPRPDMGEPSGCTTTGDPPDTNGVVGPSRHQRGQRLRHAERWRSGRALRSAGRPLVRHAVLAAELRRQHRAVVPVRRCVADGGSDGRLLPLRLPIQRSDQ